MGQKEIQVFERGDYPVKVKAFKPAIDNLDLDKILEAAKANDFEFKVHIRRGTSRRDAMIAIHHACYFELKKIDMEAVEEAVTETKVLASSDHFHTQIESFTVDESLSSKLGNSLIILSNVQWP